MKIKIGDKIVGDVETLDIGEQDGYSKDINTYTINTDTHTFKINDGTEWKFNINLEDGSVEITPMEVAPYTIGEELESRGWEAVKPCEHPLVLDSEEVLKRRFEK